MNKVIVITGPTAVGKTKLSIELAKYFNGEIINADSTQIFKKLDIATAKINEEEKENIIHHLIDIKNIDEDYTVYDYQKDCRCKIEEICNKGKKVFLVGGTGLYIKAVLYDYKFENEILSNQYKDLSNDEIYEKLIKIDSNNSVHKNNRQRLIRALNYCINNNRLYSEKEKTEKLLYNPIIIGLTTDRKTLYERIDYRVDKMINNGLIEEAKKIYDTKIRSKAVMTPIGYKELFMYFDKQISLEDAIITIKQRSRKYAKRQYTWFNNQMNINWFSVDFNDFNNTVNEVIEYIKRH